MRVYIRCVVASGLLVSLAAPVEAAISYVTQTSQLITRTDGTKSAPNIWVEVAPSVTGMTINFPAWTLYYADQSLRIPAATLTLRAHPNQTKQVRIYVVPAGQSPNHYVVIDQDVPNQRVEALDQRGPIVPLVCWFDLPPGTTDLSTVEIHVLKHVQE